MRIKPALILNWTLPLLTLVAWEVFGRLGMLPRYLSVPTQIAAALRMSLDERRERWHAMVAKLRGSSVQDWFAAFVRALSETRRSPARLAVARTPTTPLVLEIAGRGAQRH